MQKEKKRKDNERERDKMKDIEKKIERNLGKIKKGLLNRGPFVNKLIFQIY